MRMWPQIVFIIFVFIECITVAAKNGQTKIINKYDITETLFGYGLVGFLMYMGGFFDVLFKHVI